MGFITGALAGFAAFGPVGAVIGGLGGAISSGLAAAGQRQQDLTAIEQENTTLANQLAQAEALNEIESGQRQAAADARMGVNSTQAARFAANQELLATQGVAGAERQMTLLGMNAQAQNAQANQQFIDMNFSRSQDLGRSQQTAALSGLRNTGSVRSAGTMQENLYGRQIDSANRQLSMNRNIVGGQLANARITSTEAAAQLRRQGTERLTAADEANALLQLGVDQAKEIADQRLTDLTTNINQELAWNEDENDFLNNEGLFSFALQTII